MSKTEAEIHNAAIEAAAKKLASEAAYHEALAEDASGFSKGEDLHLRYKAIAEALRNGEKQIRALTKAHPVGPGEGEKV